MDQGYRCGSSGGDQRKGMIWNQCQRIDQHYVASLYVCVRVSQSNRVKCSKCIGAGVHMELNRAEEEGDGPVEGRGGQLLVSLKIILASSPRV